MLSAGGDMIPTKGKHDKDSVQSFTVQTSERLVLRLRQLRSDGGMLAAIGWRAAVPAASAASSRLRQQLGAEDFGSGASQEVAVARSAAAEAAACVGAKGLARAAHHLSVLIDECSVALDCELQDTTLFDPVDPSLSESHRA